MEATQKQLQLDGEIKIFDPSKTFGVIAEEVRVGLPSDRVLTEIIIDNRPVDLVEEEELNKKEFSILGDVVLKTRQVDELFRESLTVAPRICEALQMDCDELENFLNTDKFQEAANRLTEMSALLEWLIQLVVGAQSLGDKRVEDMTFSQGKVMDSCTRMQFQLVQLHSNLADSKWDAFRKILKGDFKSELKIWETMFSDLSTNWTPRTSVRDS
ncbi:MAG: hypothetical protein JWQ35_1423 [Bacteriovoracaceae bacterium]|nr:hypothetical protein [Bacteriovoracaceae bacterium]